VSYTYLGLDWYVAVTYPQPLVKLTYQRAPGQPVGDAGDPYTGYDRFGRTVDMRWETTNGLTQLDHFQWGYDRADNRRWKANLAASSGQDEYYGYDGLYQVEQAALGDLNINRTAIAGVPAEQEDFDYDPTGNWDAYKLTEDDTVSLDQSRVNNRDNQVTQLDGSSALVAHDKNGNSTLMPPDASGDWTEAYTLSWDAWNRLVAVEDSASSTVATYAYDGLYRRTTRTVGATTTHFYYNDDWRPVETREDAATTAVSLVISGRASHGRWRRSIDRSIGET